MFMFEEFFVKVIKISHLITWTLILLLCDVTCKSFNFVSISTSLVIFAKFSKKEKGWGSHSTYKSFRKHL